MSKKRKNYEEVHLSDLLEPNGIKTNAVKPLTIQDKIKKNTKSVTGYVGCLAVIGAIGFAGMLPAPYAAVKAAETPIEYYKYLPSEMPDTTIAQRNVLYDVNGKPFAEIYSEDRILLDSLDKVSDNVKNALISTEDKRFYEHGGFDPTGTLRSALRRSGGGSGITQQLVKNSQFYDLAGRENRDKAIESTIARKIQELKFSLDYEKDHTKDEILLNYLNLVSFGSPTTYSIQTASKYFFNKNAKDLNVAESAVLVGSVQNPVIYNLKNVTPEVLNEYASISGEKGAKAGRDYLAKKVKEKAISESESKAIKRIKDRQYAVLLRMQDEGHITKKEVDSSYASPLELVYKSTSSGNCSTSKYANYCDRVMRELENSPRLGETPEDRAAVLAKGGLQIHTYLDPEVQDTMQAQLTSDFGNTNRASAPTAIVQPGTGGIVAAAVNREYGEGEGKTTIDAPSAKMGTGSTFKMITLAAALENGMTREQLQYATSCPLYFKDFDEPPKGFQNSLGCDNPMQSKLLNFQEATAYSSNTWYTTLAEKIAYKNGQFIGLEPIFDMSEKLGLHVPENVGPRSMSYVLGATGNSPIDMSAAFATFANEGVYCKPTSIKDYTYADGTTPVVPDNYDPAQDACKAVMTPYTASTVLEAMRGATNPGVVNNAFNTKANIPGYDAVGKSGTNQTYNFTWAQVSKKYSIYTNVTDMEKPSRGVYKNIYYAGAYSVNPAESTGSTILRKVLAGTKNVKLDYNNRSRDYKEVPVEQRDFFTVPSVLGMEPGEALSTIRSTGVTAHISKDKMEASPEMPSGVVVQQSVEAGTKLAVGTKKEVILYISE